MHQRKRSFLFPRSRAFASQRCEPFIAALVLTVGLSQAAGTPPQPTRTPLVRVVDLAIGDRCQVELCDGSTATVRVLALHETRDTLRDAVRAARVKVEVNGETVELVSATYHLPTRVGGVQIDCPITRGYRSNTTRDVWGLERDVRLRLWPADSPLVAPGTFAYPLTQRWFASYTHMANEPCFVDGGERPDAKRVYYHWGLDFGGTEGRVDVVAATDGLVVSRGTDVLPGYDDTPIAERYDVIYLLDDRGWYYRYSHLESIDAGVRLGEKVRMGQTIGVLGKEGGSGGWSHLHFDINSRQPSGRWGIQEGYAFIWEAYRDRYEPKLIANARPHHFARVGEEVVLDATRSWCGDGAIRQFEWTLHDNTTATGPTVTRRYDQAGTYAEILKVTDSRGRTAYDFAAVQIIDSADAGRLPPTIHAVYAPTTNIRVGDPVTFKVRSFRTREGGETWDFGDGSPRVRVKSDGNAVKHAKDGYATTVHRFARPGDYIVSVEHVNEHGLKALARLHVRVDARE